MLSCWEKSTDKRPVFENIVTHIEKMMVPLADYMDFTTFSEGVHSDI